MRSHPPRDGNGQLGRICGLQAVLLLLLFPIVVPVLIARTLWIRRRASWVERGVAA